MATPLALAFVASNAVLPSLQGLIPRAKELIKLGGGFFLAFVPAVIVISLLFTGMFAVSRL